MKYCSKSRARLLFDIANSVSNVDYFYLCRSSPCCLDLVLNWCHKDMRSRVRLKIKRYMTMMDSMTDAGKLGWWVNPCVRILPRLTPWRSIVLTSNYHSRAWQRKSEADEGIANYSDCSGIDLLHECNMISSSLQHMELINTNYEVQKFTKTTKDLLLHLISRVTLIVRWSLKNKFVNIKNGFDKGGF